MSTLMDDFINAESLGGDDLDELIDLDLSDIFDEIVLKTGSEAKLRCVAAEAKKDRNGAPYWSLRYEVVGNPRVKAIYHNIWFPKPEVHDPKQVNAKKQAFKVWKLAHEVPLSQPMRAADAVGLEAWAILRLVSSPGYEDKNEVAQWIYKKNG